MKYRSHRGSLEESMNTVVNMKKRHNFPHEIDFDCPTWLDKINSIHFHNLQIIIKKQ